jgi:benzoyl-CoA 2,3-dioxygenase component A
MNSAALYIKQHLIDPASCIRCNACVEACSRIAIDFDGTNYIVDPATCNGCQDCVPGCPTGAVNHWYMVPADRPYTLAEQSGWSELPEPEAADAPPPATPHEGTAVPRAPWSAAAPQTMRFTPAAPLTATVRVNARVASGEGETEIRRIVLDVGAGSLGAVEGQSIGILPPGNDAEGRPHHMRAYSIASARDGEIAGDNTVTITVKRVVDSWDGQPYRGVASNYLCDLEPGAAVRCVGPIGATFLAPQHPESRLLMIATGTGIAPMRAFVQQRLRQLPDSRDDMLLFYGGRTPAEMAYIDELRQIDAQRLQLKLAFSRLPDQPRQYVQDLLRAEGDTIASLLQDDHCFIYLCGLKSMEAGVIEALTGICRSHGFGWEALRAELLTKGRLHVETY